MHYGARNQPDVPGAVELRAARHDPPGDQRRAHQGQGQQPWRVRSIMDQLRIITATGQF